MKVILHRKRKCMVRKKTLTRGRGLTDEQTSTVVLTTVPTGLLILRNLAKYKGVAYIAYDMNARGFSYSEIVEEASRRVSEVVLGETLTTMGFKLGVAGTVGNLVLEKVPLSDIQIYEYELGKGVTKIAGGVNNAVKSITENATAKYVKGALSNACEYLSSSTKSIASSAANAAVSLMNVLMQNGVNEYISSGKDSSVSADASSIESDIPLEALSIEEISALVQFRLFLAVMEAATRLDITDQYDDDAVKDDEIEKAAEDVSRDKFDDPINDEVTIDEAPEQGDLDPIEMPEEHYMEGLGVKRSKKMRLNKLKLFIR